MNNIENRGVWLIPANEEVYDHQSSFERNGFIDWHTAGRIFEVGDIAYIYSTVPVGEVLYETVVTKTNIPVDEATNDQEFWKNGSDFSKSRKGLFVRLKLVAVCNNHHLTYQEMLKHGLKRPAPLSAMVLKDELLEFVTAAFPLVNNPNDVASDEVYDEGSVDNVHKDTYERSRLARQKCIAEKGLRCAICGMSFEETYGPVGKISYIFTTLNR